MNTDTKRTYEWSYATATTGVIDTADDEAQAAPGASRRLYVTGAQITNAHATTGTECVIKHGSTVLWRNWVAPAGGVVSAVFDPPLQGAANAAINVANITDASQTYFSLQGFIE